jgi:predicted nucleic acid-binding protein
VAQLDKIEPPLLTCEPVLSEACFLLRHDPAGPAAVLDLVHDDLVRVGVHVPTEIVALRQLVRKYSQLPISLADACLIRLAELNAGSVLLTLDSDFKIYRMHGRQVVPTLMPTGI